MNNAFLLVLGPDGRIVQTSGGAREWLGMRIDDAVGVVPVLPDFAGVVFADGEGEAAFEELNAALDGVVGGGSEEEVDMVGHDGEGVEREAALFAIAEERGEHDFRGRGALEDSEALMRDCSDGEGFGVDADAEVRRRGHVSGAKARSFSGSLMCGLKPGPITSTAATAEARARAETRATAEQQQKQGVV